MRRNLSMMTALACLSASVPVSAEVVSTTVTGFVTRDTATVAVSPLETWLALIKPGDWWNDRHSWSGDAGNMVLTPQAGGCFCETIPGDDSANGYAMDGSALHATVVQAFPLRVLRMRGGFGPLQGEPATGVLTITMEEIEGGTRILWEYNVGGPMRYEIGQISGAVDAVMSEQLRGLQAHLGALDGVEPPAVATDSEPDEPPEEPSLEAQIDALADDD
ncbi:SRPBCC family protein [Qipengyuania sp. MTN3-11]|uniref:SRPBCC family protein n=1 Tax=Qipengyuania sp. MTN3-11 TaxID=3056557 RepID=UPI0036F2F074